MTNIPTLRHINLCKQNHIVMKYGVNHVTLFGNVGDGPRVLEKEGKAFVANFPIPTLELT